MLIELSCVSEDDTMHITLQKRDKGQTWSLPIVGEGQLDPYSVDLEQKRLMLQRFQEEVMYCYLILIHLLLIVVVLIYECLLDSIEVLCIENTTLTIPPSVIPLMRCQERSKYKQLYSCKYH